MQGTGGHDQAREEDAVSVHGYTVGKHSENESLGEGGGCDKGVQLHREMIVMKQ
jgi:hypothetical protein